MRNDYTVGELYQIDLIVEAYSKLVPSTRETTTPTDIRPWGDLDLEWEG